MASNIAVQQLNPSNQLLINQIATWYYQQWQTPLERTVQRLTHPSEDDVLFQLVLSINNEVVATGGLGHQVGLLKEYPQYDCYGPWVTLLYTTVTYRNRGLGTHLLQQIEDKAKTHKLSKIYLYTDTAEALYLRCGWQPIHRVTYKGNPTVLMEKVL